MTRHLTLIFLILTSLTFLGQTKKKTLKFPECDSLKDSPLDFVLSTDLKSTDGEITNWLKKNSSGKKLNGGAEFSFILNSKKGVCCKKLIILDTTKTNVKDLIYLILKLTDYPEFKQLAKNSSKTKLLSGLVYIDKAKNEHEIGLMLVLMPDK